MKIWEIMDTVELSDEKKEVSLLYARKIDDLSEDKLKMLKEFLNGED